MDSSGGTQKPLSKENLIQLISNKDISITFSKQNEKNTTSKVWTYFSTIFVHNVKQDYVMCDCCMALLVYKHATGTGGMRKHIDSCPKKPYSNNGSGENKLTSYFNLTKNKLNHVSREMKEKITNALIEFLILDGRPFETVHGNGFINLIDVVLSMGRGLLDSCAVSASDLLADPRTLSRRVDRLYEEQKVQLKALCQTFKSFTITVDFWTEQYTGIHYCGISVHHINNNNQLQTFILACRAYDLENQTSPNIRKFVNSVLKEYDLVLSSSSFVVSDNENKMKCAFNDVNRVGCSLHYINKIMEKTFTDNRNIDLKVANELFVQVKEIVEHVRRCHKQNKLSKKLQIYSKTKFNGAFHMLNIFDEIFDEIPQALNANYLLTYSLMNQQILRQICDLISIFDQVFEKLSDDQRPTLHRVVPFRQHLIDHCSTSDDDDLYLVICEDSLTTWIPQDVHLLATIVHPQLKHFDKIPTYKQKACELLQAEIKRRVQLNNSSSSSSSIITAQSPSSTASGVDGDSSLSSTRNKTTSILSSCYDTPRLSTAPMDEYTSWMSSTLTLNDDENDDILQFWFQFGHLFPTVAAIARDVLAIPASNTSIERLFSQSKNLITDKRTNMGVEKIDRILCLKKNLNIFKNLLNSDSYKGEQYETKRKQNQQTSELLDNNSKKLKLNEDNEIILQK